MLRANLPFLPCTQAMDTTAKATSHWRHWLAQPHDKHKGARGPRLCYCAGGEGGKKPPYGEFYKAAFQQEQAPLYCKGIAQRGKSGSSSHRSETGGWEARRQLRQRSEAASPWAKTARHVPLPEFQQTAALSNSRCLRSCGALPFSPPAPTAAPPAGHGQVGPSRRAPSPTGTARRAPCTAAAEGEGFGHKNPVPPFRRRKGTRGCSAFLALLYPCRANTQAGTPSPAARQKPTLGTAPLCALCSNPPKMFPGFSRGQSPCRAGTGVPRDPAPRHP